MHYFPRRFTYQTQHISSPFSPCYHLCRRRGFAPHQYIPFPLRCLCAEAVDAVPVSHQISFVSYVRMSNLTVSCLFVCLSVYCYFFFGLPFQSRRFWCGIFERKAYPIYSFWVGCIVWTTNPSSSSSSSYLFLFCCLLRRSTLCGKGKQSITICWAGWAAVIFLLALGGSRGCWVACIYVCVCVRTTTLVQNLRLCSYLVWIDIYHAFFHLTILNLLFSSAVALV